MHTVVLSKTMHAQLSSEARCLMCNMCFHLLPYFMCTNSKGSDETAPRLEHSLLAHVSKNQILRYWLFSDFEQKQTQTKIFDCILSIDKERKTHVLFPLYCFHFSKIISFLLVIIIT